MTTSDPPQPAPPSAPSGAEVLDALMGRYPEAQYHFVGFLSEHLADCSRVFKGDFGQVVLMAVLGQRFLQASILARNQPERGQEMIWMTASRLADTTGLPRETVRRKLKLLVGRGWVRSDPDKGWTLDGDFLWVTARSELADLDKRGIQRLARLFVTVRSLLPQDQKA